MKQKILFVYYQNIKQGGISKSISHLTENLVNNGFDVTILFLMEEHDDFFPIDKRVNKIYIDAFNTPYFKRTHQLNTKGILKGKVRKLVNYGYDYGSYQVLTNWINANHQNYDKIITCWYKLSTYLSYTEAAKKTIAWEHISHTIGGLIFFNLLRKRYKKLYGIITLTDDSKKFYENLHQNVYKIPNIIGDRFENFQLDTQKKENIILLASRLDPEKNVKEFIEIIKEVNLPSDWQVQIAGAGFITEEVKEHAKSLNCNNIQFLGVVSSDKMLELYSKTKIFCMTSLKEGLPTTLIEAVFCGNALISYDCPTGPSEIVNDQNGFLVPLRDKQVFKEKLDFLVKNSLELEQLMQSAHIDAKRWSKNEILKKWEQILK